MKLPVNWKRVPIREVYDGLYDGPHATPQPSGEGPIFLGIGNITEDGHLDYSKVRHISEEEYPKWTKRVTPQQGDIVFTYEATLNRYAIIPKNFRGCLGRRMALIRPNTEKIDTRFLHYYFFGKDWRGTIEANKLAGATVDRVPLTNFPEFPISLPPLGVQKSIASILSAYDDLIENNTRRIQILEEMARRLYEEWFVHFRFPRHEEVSFKESELGDIPDGWKVGVLQDVIVLQRGFDLPVKKRTPGDFPIVSATGVSGSHSEAKIDGPGVVTGRSGSIGKVMYIHGSYWPLNTALWGKAFPLGSSLFAFYTLSAIDLNGFNVGAAVPTLNRNDIHGLPVILPAKELVQLFDQMAAPMHDLIFALEKKSANLRSQRDLLLPKLVSGEISLSDIPTPEDKEFHAA
jgi:type I restriction enzyme S subunit